jgi:hypothetical protein
MPINEIRELLVASQESNDAVQAVSSDSYEKIQTMIERVKRIITKREILRGHVVAYEHDHETFTRTSNVVRDTRSIENTLHWVMGRVSPESTAAIEDSMDELKRVGLAFQEKQELLADHRTREWPRETLRELERADQWLTYLTGAMTDIDSASESAMNLGTTIAEEIDRIERS